METEASKVPALTSYTPITVPPLGAKTTFVPTAAAPKKPFTGVVPVETEVKVLVLTS